MAAVLAPWSGMEFVFVFTMWAVMMVGMMMPSAVPMILTYARLGRQATIADNPFVATGWFAAGYLLAWLGFALAATAIFIQQYGGFRRDIASCLLLGLRHGAYCLGCCWLLMALLFVGGVMNFLWIALLASLILLEKLFNSGRWIAQATGVALFTTGIWRLILECGCYTWTRSHSMSASFGESTRDRQRRIRL